MSFTKIWKAWLCAAFLPLLFGGESSSDSSTRTESTVNNTTNYADKRIVGGDGALAVSGNGNSVVMTDAGAVNAAIDLAGKVSGKALDTTATGIAGIIDALKAAATANQATFEKSLKLIGDNADATNSAFQKANEEVNGNRVLVVVGMIVVGYVIASSGMLK